VVFALDNPDLLSLAVQIFHLEMAGLVQTQARAVNGHQKNPRLPRRRTHAQQALDLLVTVNPRAMDLPHHPWQRLPQHRQLPMQYPLVKGPQAADRHVDRTGRQLLLLDQIEQILPQLGLTDLVRRHPVMPRQMINPRHVALLRAGCGPS
jgi:hypothetical protein